MTHAYKSLLAEKKAFEITIKALKTKTAPAQSNLVGLAATGLSNSSRSVSDVSEHESTTGDPAAIAKETDNSESKISALTSNIQVLLDAKSKMEANYLAEKKKLRADLEEMKNKYDNLKAETEKTSEVYETKLKEVSFFIFSIQKIIC